MYNLSTRIHLQVYIYTYGISFLILYVYVALCLIAYVFVFVHVCVNLFEVTCVGVFLFVLLRCVRIIPAKVLFESEKYIICEQIYYHQNKYQLIYTYVCFNFVSAIVLSAFSGICVYDYPEIRNICILGMKTYIYNLKARTPLQSQESHGNFFVVYPMVFFYPFCIHHPSVFHFAPFFPHKRYLFTYLIFPQYHANASGFNCCHFIPTWNGLCSKKSGFSTEFGLQANQIDCSHAETNILFLVM